MVILGYIVVSLVYLTFFHRKPMSSVFS